MGEIKDTAVDVYRDFATAGVPSSGPNEPVKSDIRGLFSLIDLRIAASVAGIIYYATGAARAADTAQPVGTLGKAADEADYYRRQGAGWVVDNTVYAGVAAVVQPLIDEVEEKADASLLAAASTAGATIAIPIAGNPNELRVTVPNATTVPFKILIVATNTGPVFLTPSTGTRLQVTNGGGVPYAAGGLPAGNTADVEYSSGGAWVVSNITEADGSGAVQRSDPDLADKPWGTVTFSGSGVRTVTPVNKYLVMTGSSNAHPDYVGAGQLPSTIVVGALNEAYAGSGIGWISDNQAEAGAPSAAIFDQLASSYFYQVGGQTPYVMTFFGMNDCRTLFYHSQGGVLQEIENLRAAIYAIRKRGSEPVLNTIFPPDPRASGVALDPFFFTTSGALPTGGTTSNMDFPAFKAAPVNPETQMQPPASQALTGPRDWTGSGVLRQGYKRIQHWNEMIRALAAELNVMVLDFEWLAYRAAIETVPDLGSGLDTYYDQANPLHPKDALYAAAVTPILRQWARYIRSGRQDVRVFRNQDMDDARMIVAGNGLSGGGDGSANRIIGVVVPTDDEVEAAARVDRFMSLASYAVQRDTWQFQNYETSIVKDDAGGFVDYGKFVLSREGSPPKVVVPAAYGLTTFRNTLSTTALAVHHYIDMDRIDNPVAGQNPIRELTSGQVKAARQRIIPLANSSFGKYFCYWSNDVVSADSAGAFAIPPKLFLYTGRPQTIFPENLLHDARWMGDHVFSAASDPGLGKRPFMASTNTSMLVDPACLGPQLKVSAQLRTTTASFYSRTMAVSVAATAPSRTAMFIGDSKTNRGLAQATKLKYADAGGNTLTLVGTMTDTQGGATEGREGWQYADFTYENTRYPPVAVGGEAAYQAMTYTQKNAVNPFIRAATGGDAAGIVKNGYVFDLAFYLSRFGYAAPDRVCFALGVNDALNVTPASTAAAQIQRNMSLLYDRVRAALPSAKIAFGVWASGYPNANGIDYGLTYDLLIRPHIQFVAGKGDANLAFLPFYLHENRRIDWPQTVTSTDTWGVNTVTLADGLHEDLINKSAAAECAMAWAAS